MTHRIHEFIKWQANLSWAQAVQLVLLVYLLIWCVAYVAGGEDRP